MENPNSFNVYTKEGGRWILINNPVFSEGRDYALVPKTHQEFFKAWKDGELQPFDVYCEEWSTYKSEYPPSFTMPVENYRRKPKLVTIELTPEQLEKVKAVLND
jgi:hypothetical protein